MKKRTYVISMAVLSLVLLCFGCKETTPQETKDTVDVSDLIQLYQQAKNDPDKMGSTEDSVLQSMLTDSVAKGDDESQGYCTLTKWAIQLPATKHQDHPFLVHAQEIYNIHALAFDIYADFENWARVYDMHDEVPQEITDRIVGVINEADFTPFKDEKTRETMTKYRDEMVWMIEHPDDWGEDHHPILACNEATTDLCSEPLNAEADTNQVDAYFKVLEEKVTMYDSVQQKIAKLDEGKRVEALLKRVQDCKTFDEQCGVLLACCAHTETYDDLWSFLLLDRMLRSGHYTVLLEQLWGVWRAQGQIAFGGISRDSLIPNYTYNKMRREVFKTVMAHLEEHPDDPNAMMCAITLATKPHLIRNGDFIAGNNAPIEVLQYTPDFFGSEEEEN